MYCQFEHIFIYDILLFFNGIHEIEDLFAAFYLFLIEAHDVFVHTYFLLVLMICFAIAPQLLTKSRFGVANASHLT